METSNFFKQISAKRKQLQELARRLTHSDVIVDHPFKKEFVDIEAFFIKLFMSAKPKVLVPYVAYSASDSQSMAVSIVSLRDAVTFFQKGWLTPFVTEVRTIMTEATAGTPLKQNPSLNLNDVISSGLLSTVDAPYRAAQRLEERVSSLEAVFPSLRLSIKPQMETARFETLNDYATSIASGLPMLHLDAKVMQVNKSSWKKVHYRRAGVGTHPVGAAAANSLVTTVEGGMYAVGAPAAASSYISIVDNSIVVAAGTTVPAANDATAIITPSRVGRLRVVVSKLDTFVINATNGVPEARPFQTAATYSLLVNGVTYGPYTPPAYDRTVTFDVIFDQAALTANATVQVIPSLGSASHKITVYEDVGSQGLLVSPNGVANVQPIAQGRMRDLIGGGVSENSDIINLWHFDKVEAWLETSRAAHTDLGLQIVLSGYYLLIKQTDDTAATLPAAYGFTPLLSREFWFGRNSIAGVTKFTRIRLWEKYISMVSDLLALESVDGNVLKFMSG